MASTTDNYNMASSLRIDADYANASMAHFMSSSPDSMSSPFSSTSDAAMHSLASSSSLSSASSSGGEPATPPPSMIKSAPATSSSMDLKHKPHKCDVCGSSFARKVHLQRHSLRHQVCKPYCCELCGKCFSRQDSLVRHHRLLHDGVTTSISSGNLSMTDDKKSTKKTPAAKRASTGSILTVRASTACLRCSSAGTACDGQQPCARCTLNQGAESCCYASPSSSPSKRARRRHDSVATSSSSISMLAEEDEDWSAAHGVRRDTASSVTSSSSTISELMSPVTSSYSLEDGNMAWNTAAQTMIVHPHPFELPLQDSLLMAGFGGQHGDVKSLHPQQLQHDGGIALPFDVSLMSMLPSESQQTAPFSQTVMPLFDWSSLMNGHAEQQQLQQQLQLQAQQLSLLQQHVQAQANMAAAAAAAAAAKQPFSGAASNKSLNATLLGGQESGYSSPSMYGMQNAHLLAAAAAAYPPSNLSLNLSAAQTATDNWDGFMRQLSSPYHSAAVAQAAAANSMVA